MQSSFCKKVVTHAVWHTREKRERRLSKMMTRKESKWNKLFDTAGTTLEEKLPQAEKEGWKGCCVYEERR